MIKAILPTRDRLLVEIIDGIVVGMMWDLLPLKDCVFYRKKIDDRDWQTSTLEAIYNDCYWMILEE